MVRLFYSMINIFGNLKYFLIFTSPTLLYSENIHLFGESEYA